MKLTQQPCVNGTAQVTRRVFVDLWAHETLLQKRRLVLELPFDCTDEDVRAIGSFQLDDLADIEQVDSNFETEELDDFDVLNELAFESGVPDHIAPDLRFEWDDNDGLVLTGRENDN